MLHTIFIFPGNLLITFFNRFIWNKEAPFPAWLCTGRTGIGNLNNLSFISRSLTMSVLRKHPWLVKSLQKRTTRHLSYTPSQEGSGWLQKWFFSQTSGSSWLSLYPRSHWNDTVEPMDRSVLDRAPLTGIPGSMQEYVSNVTTAEMQKYTEFFFVVVVLYNLWNGNLLCFTQSYVRRWCGNSIQEVVLDLHSA